MQLLVNFCVSRGCKVDGIYKDVASALDFDSREAFMELLEEVMNYRIERIVVAYRDRLTRIGWNFFENFFRKFGAEVVVVHDYIPEKTDMEELMEEIMTLLHSFSMKFYSRRRKIRKVLEEALS
ncbi:MAG: recombinase family protein [Candidatus Baldrarchaeia archaeon]